MDEDRRDDKIIQSEFLMKNNELTKQDQLIKDHASYFEYLRRLFFINIILNLRNRRYIANGYTDDYEIIDNKDYANKTIIEKLFNVSFYIASPLITIFIIAFIYYIKDIYPFGENTIIWGDLGQSTANLYYHIYDVLHGTKSFFYNFNVSSGANMYGIGTFSGLLSPISWIIALFKREEIVYALSYLLMIRYALSALTASVFFKKVFPTLALNINVGLSLMYAFSAYSLTQYTNMMWLDMVIWFPLLILSLKEMLDNHIVKWYVIMLTLCLISNFYIGFMILLFIFFSSMVYIHCFLYYCWIKRALSIFYLGIGTLLSLLISSVVLIPSYIQIKQSSRNESFNYKAIIGEFNGQTSYKLMFFLFAALPLVMLIILIHTYNKHKRFTWFIFLSLLLTIIQAFVESINLIWHTGSYNAFPYRYAFIPIFIMLIACGYVLVNENKPIIPKFSKDNKYLYILILLSIIIIPLIYAILLIKKHFLAINNSVDSFSMNNFLISRFFLVFLLFAISYRVLLFLQNKKLFPVIFLSVAVLEITIHSILFIGVPKESVGIERKDVYFGIEEAVKSEIEKDSLIRIKDKDRVMSDNYPLVLDMPSISGWIHIIPPEVQNSLNKLGYTRLFTRTIDTGGTVFSDSLLGIGKVISRLDVNKSLATLVKDTKIPTENKSINEDVHIYDYNYKLPFFKVVPKKIKEFNLKNNVSAIENQNNLYFALTEEKDPLFKLANITNISNDNNNLTLYLDVKNESTLYLNAMGQSKQFNIFVNDAAVLLPFLSYKDNKLYPQGWQSGLVELGVFKDQRVKVTISEPNLNPSNLLYVLDLGDYKNYIDKINKSNIDFSYGGRSINIEAITKRDDECIFLPITYEEGWKCTLNGENATINKVAGCFMMVELKNGVNNLRFDFLPPYFIPSLIISIGTIIFIAAFYFTNRVEPIKYNDYIIFGTYYIYHFIYFIGFLLVYLIPTFKLLQHIIEKT